MNDYVGYKLISCVINNKISINYYYKFIKLK